MVRNMGAGEKDFDEIKQHLNIKKSISENITVKELIKKEKI